MGPFRALSIDLWFTTYYHSPEAPARWDAARLQVLQQYLRQPDGRPLDPESIGRAMREAYAGLSEAPHAAIRTDPSRIVQAVAASLGATVPGGSEAAAAAYSAAGLAELPPIPNPDAAALLAWCAAHAVPSVLVTNSARRAVTWHEHLRRTDGPRFEHIVSSCDLGRGKPDPAIFLEAARRLELEPAEILHVGDRWELDVAGARAAGFGAALYRGLWDRYPVGLYDQAPPAPPEAPGVRIVDRLDALADARLWAPAGSRSPTG